MAETLQDGRLRLFVRAQSLEHIRVDPDAVATGALQELRRADVHSLERTVAGGTLQPRIVFGPTRARCTALVAIGGALKSKGKARRAADRSEPRAAVRAAPGIRVGCGAAIRTMQAGSIHE